MEKIKIQLCGGKLPAKAHKDDACFDLYVPKRTVIYIGRQIIPLDFKMQLTPQWCAYIRSRSGFASKGIIAYLSCDTEYKYPIRIDADVITGIVDSGYIGIVGVIVNCKGGILDIPEDSVEYFNKMTQKDSGWDRSVVIKAGERIAQMAILPVPEVQFEVVDKMYTCVGLTDNSTPWWTAFSDDIKVGPKETFVSTFTNYTNGAANWNNFLVILRKADKGEYAVMRADNFGWGAGYDGIATPATEEGRNWDAWAAAMDGAKVTTYVTNNGDGTADVKAVIEGNDGNIYTQDYTGIGNVDPNDFYFCFTVEGGHLEFDNVLGLEDNSTPWWTAHSADITVPSGQTYTTRFKNYTNGAANWNNFLVVLTRADNSEYAVMRADNFGWGASYDGIATPTTEEGRNWEAWAAAMDESTVTVSVTNNGTSADVKCIIVGNDGNTYTQNYTGISPIEADNFRFRFTCEGSHLVFE